MIKINVKNRLFTKCGAMCKLKKNIKNFKNV